ncbi:adhesion G-protein coupled receptor D1-like [Saccostrea echinata]|uniref:adhesion G-protein coupled receptor D1-like n=1 Tax=Saccostrea echinata TaxID=191078 RepID=UPI002A80E832|nr:adhesion G-protein coupled receptor D1-like [Saccostrea echinata]
MASYTFLMDVGNASLTDSEVSSMVKLSVTGSGFSLVGTMLSLCLICFLPVASDGMFILINMNVSLIGAQLALIGAENSFQSKLVCRTATAVIHYFFLTLQFCSLSYGLHLLSKLKSLAFMERCHKRVTALFICWVPAMVVVGLTAALRGDTYGTGSLCWLTAEKGTRWAFVGPTLAIQLVNLNVFGLIMTTRFAMDVKRNFGFRRVAKNQLLTAMSLIPVLGLMWSLGLATTFGISRTTQYVFVALCSTQGMCIFLGHVLTNSHVRRLLCIKIKPEEDNDEDASVTNEISNEVTYVSQLSEMREMPRGSLTNNEKEREVEKERSLSETDIQVSPKNLLNVPEGKCRQRTPRHSLK